MNEEIVVEILTRLPPKSIFRFISVSKIWEKLIKHPYFLKSYSRRHCSDGGRLLALFERPPSPSPPYCNPGMINLACKHPTNMLTINPTSWDHHINFTHLRHLITSSDGLILCFPDKFVHNHVVINPVTGKSVSLPWPPRLPQSNPPYEYKSVGLMCEENTTELKPNFIVVRAFTISRYCGDCFGEREKFNSMKMQTYSSMTGEWTLSTLVASDPVELSCEPPFVLNGVFYWRGFESNVVVYDPKNKDQDKVQLIELPTYRVCCVGLTPNGVLWSNSFEGLRIKLWMLKDEWVLKYNIYLNLKI